MYLRQTRLHWLMKLPRSFQGQKCIFFILISHGMYIVFFLSGNTTWYHIHLRVLQTSYSLPSKTAEWSRNERTEVEAEEEGEDVGAGRQQRAAEKEGRCVWGNQQIHAYCTFTRNVVVNVKWNFNTCTLQSCLRSHCNCWGVKVCRDGRFYTVFHNVSSSQGPVTS